MKDKKQIILVRIDEDSEMAQVHINDKCVMEGNYWDFHPGCHGINEYGNFRTYSELVQQIFLYLRHKGFDKIEIHKEKYKY